MDRFIYYRYSLSRAGVARTPVPNSHALQLNVKHRFIRVNPFHGRPCDTFPPSSTTSYRFPVPQRCVTYAAAAFYHVSTLLSSMGIVLEASEVGFITSCLLQGCMEQGRGSIVVIASLTVWSTDDVTVTIEDVMRPMILEDSSGADETMIFDAVSFNLSDETLIFDAVSSVSPKRVELERATVKDGSCAICLDEFDEGCSASRTSCAHVFHDDCIGKWMRKKYKKPDCPLCRSQLAG